MQAKRKTLLTDPLHVWTQAAMDAASRSFLPCRVYGFQILTLRERMPASRVASANP